MDIKINIDSKDFREKLSGIEDGFKNSKEINQVGIEGIEQSIRARLREMYLPKDKNGLTFWERVIKSIKTKADSKGGEVSLTETGIALRYYGGVVRPGKNPARSGPNKGNATKALAIPTDNVKVSNGRRVSPANAGTLAFLRGKGDSDTVGYLVKGRKVKNSIRPIPRGKSGSALMYVLRKKTTHKPDKGILPTEQELSEAATSGIMAYLDTFLD